MEEEDLKEISEELFDKPMWQATHGSSRLRKMGKLF